MSIFTELVARVRSLFGRERESRELAEEIRFHIERETEKNIAGGMSAKEARRAAHLAFGGVDRWTERWRETRGVDSVERWARDARLAARRLTREPEIAVPVLLTLALGIGSATAVFALVHAILIQPLPYPEADDLVEVGHTTAASGMERVGQSPGTYAHYRSGNRVFADMALFYENAVSVSVTDGDAPERVRVAMVTPSFFAVMGVEPSLGRAFTDDEGRQQADTPGPVIVSHDLWVRRYAADPDLVSGSIELNRTRRQVVGIMPPGFDFPHPDTDVWYADSTAPTSGDIVRDLIMSGVARLRPGVDAAAAEADLGRLLGALDTSPELAGGAARPAVAPLRARMVEEVRRPLILLALTASIVLLATIANVVGLFLVRAERRSNELAVSRAIGAGHRDLARRFLAEGLLLAGLGGGLGVLAARAGVALRFGFSPEDLPRLHDLDFAAPSLAFAAVLCMAVALLIAGVSLLRSLRFGPTTAGSVTSSRVIGGRDWQPVHRGLAAAQVGISLALLVSSAVTVESLVRVSRVHPGFESSGVLTFRINPPASAYLRTGKAAELHRELRSRVLALPGVTGAEVVARLPLTETPNSARDYVEVVDQAAIGEAPLASFNLVSPGYFELMGIPVIYGDGFGDLRAPMDSPPVALSARLARLLFGDEDPVGRRIRLPGYLRFIELPTYTVASVVADVAAGSLTESFEPMLYFPAILDVGVAHELAEAYPLTPGELAVVVHAAMAPLGLVASVREIVRALDPKLPVADVRALDDLVRGATERLRLVALLLVLATVASLCLGLTGVYGIVAYAVSGRTAEIGIRVAVGATSAQVVRMIMLQTQRVAWVGVGVGLLAAYGLTALLADHLYEVSPTEPAAYATMSVLLLIVVLVAGWLPARRAGRLDVLKALACD